MYQLKGFSDINEKNENSDFFYDSAIYSPEFHGNQILCQGCKAKKLQGKMKK